MEYRLTVHLNDTTEVTLLNCSPHIVSNASTIDELSVSVIATNDTTVLLTLIGVDDSIVDGTTPVLVELGARGGEADLGTIQLVIECTDNDVAGLVILQYDHRQMAESGLVVVNLPIGVTTESDLTLTDAWLHSPQCGDEYPLALCSQGQIFSAAANNLSSVKADVGVAFNIIFSSQTLADVEIIVRTLPSGILSNDRIEGIPLRSTYFIDRYQSYTPWISSFKDTVRNLHSGYLHQTVTVESWNSEQLISVVGLDDCYDDGNMEYIVEVIVDSADPKYNSSAGGPRLHVKLVNVDDDVAKFELVVNSSFVSEPYYGLVVSAGFRAFAEPQATVVLQLISSWPQEILPAVDTLAIAATNWERWFNFSIDGLDDFADDGNSAAILQLTVVLTADPSYADLPDQWIELQNIDDPNDTVALSTSDMEISIISSVTLHGLPMTRQCFAVL